MPSVGTISGKLVLNIAQWQKGVNESLATTKVFQRDVNAIYKATATDVDRFRGSMQKLNAAFVQGKVGPREAAASMKLLKDQLRATLPGFKTPAINIFRADILRLKAGMQAGVITMTQYRASLRNLKTAYVTANPAIIRTTLAMRAQAAAGKAMVATGAAVRSSLLMYVGPLAAIFATFKTFKVQEDIERGMRGSLAIMKDVTGQMRDEMRATAIDVARNTIASTEEAAKAYFFLASAGLDAAQSIRALPAVAEFAQAGMFDLSRATDLLTDAQMALGLSSKNAQKNLEGMVRVSDVLVRANTIANATVSQFSEALTNKAAAAARRYGQSLEDVVSILAIYASQGVKGIDAGSRFDIVMKNLTIKALENADAFRRLNVDVYDPLTGQVRFLGDIMADLEKTMEGLTTREQVLTLMTLGFTKKTISATAALIGFSEEAKKARIELMNAAGATGDVAAAQLTEFQKGWNALAASINDSSSNLQKFNDVLGKVMGLLATPPPDIKVGFGFAGDELEAFKRLAKERKESAEFLAISLKKREFEGASRPEDKRIAQRFDELKEIAKLERERQRDAGAVGKPEALVDDKALKVNALEIAKIAGEIEKAEEAAVAFRKKLDLARETQNMTAFEKETKKVLDALVVGTAEYDRVLKAARAEAVRLNEVRRDQQRIDKILRDEQAASVAQDKVAKELDKAKDAAKQFGEQLQNQFATSEEKFAKLIKDLLQWRDIMGKLPGFDDALFDKAIKGAERTSLKGITTRDPSDFLVDTLAKGSAEAFREEVGGRAKDLELELAREQLKVQREAIVKAHQDAKGIERAVKEMEVVEGPP